MNSAEPILQPSSEENWPEGIRAALQGPVLNIHRMMAHSPELLRQSAPLRNYLVAGSTLTGRQRELLILRTAHLIGSEYEWSHHV
ncbi:MAG: carboxymuconolactone decarboxylase family protein, partial [Anaerolineales bacterium]|nr:carboxymuconolactone decarboxylase family protein [Anaerolineales bacterium]